MRRRRRIQEDSRRLPSQPEQRPHFFKIIVKASLERGELVIPKDFTRQLVKKIADVAVLKVPSGRKWQVEVKEVDGSFRFQNGLQGFLKYHSISVGHFLVFRYDGNSNFSVFIFNQSACEIDYLSDIDDDLEESKLHSNCLIPVKKEPEEEDLMEVEPLNISTPSQPLPSSNVEVLDKAQELRQITKRRRPERRRSSRKQRRKINNQELKGVKDKGLTFNVENEIEVVEVPSDDPNNETRMSTSTETSSHNMEEDAGHPNPDADNYLLWVSLPSGGDASLQSHRSEPSAPATHEVESNCLEQEGEKEISAENSTPTTKHNARKHLDPSPMKHESVRIPSSGKYDKTTAVRKRRVTNKQRERTISAARMFKTKNPSFVMIMRPSYVEKRMALYFPRLFAKRYLKNGKHDIKLSVSDGKMWMVRCILDKRRALLGRGWANFVQDNKLEVGDCCVFELSKAKGMELKIHIFRVVEEAEPVLKDDK